MKSIHLNDIPTFPPKDKDKISINEEILTLKERLSSLQELLFAQNKHSLLVILQGMDASGKDNAVKHIFSGVNPAGCKVKSFKLPSEEEKAHHFLWRVSKECPERGYLQIFNRSHYEHVLENVIQGTMDEAKMDDCLGQINAFEKGLQSDGTVVLKFYLHISQEIQYEKLQERKNDPAKSWKYQPQDELSIGKHDEYAKIYEQIFKKANAVPWQIIPSDKRWYKNYLILKEIIKTLEEITG